MFLKGGTMNFEKKQPSLTEEENETQPCNEKNDADYEAPQIEESVIFDGDGCGAWYNSK